MKLDTANCRLQGCYSFWVVPWMSRKSLLETGAISEDKWLQWDSKPQPLKAKIQGQKKKDDLILFYFNMKKLNMFNFLHIKMMKISFESNRHHCFVLATTRNLHTCVCFYVNIRFNKNKSLVQQNLKIVFEYWKKLKSKQKEKKYLTRLLLELKMLSSKKLLLKLLVAFVEPSQTSKMELFVKIINGINLRTTFKKKLHLQCLNGF